MTVDDLLAREAIRLTMARYNINGDRGRLPALAACFAEDGVLEFLGKRLAGRAAIAEGLKTPNKMSPDLRVMRHNLTTSLIEVEGDRATGRSYFQVVTDIGADQGGLYADTFARIGGQWLIAHRIVRLEWQDPRSLTETIDFGRQARG
jgi:hypothetical protein